MKIGNKSFKYLNQLKQSYYPVLYLHFRVEHIEREHAGDSGNGRIGNQI